MLKCNNPMHSNKIHRGCFILLCQKVTSVLSINCSGNILCSSISWNWRKIKDTILTSITSNLILFMGCFRFSLYRWFNFTKEVHFIILPYTPCSSCFSVVKWSDAKYGTSHARSPELQEIMIHISSRQLCDVGSRHFEITLLRFSFRFYHWPGLDNTCTTYVSISSSVRSDVIGS